MYADILPCIKRSANIIAIDPGSNHCGISVLNVTDTDMVTVLYSSTVHADICRSDDGLSLTYGYTFAKFMTICNEFNMMLRRFTPVMVISESPYMSAFPQAFGVLSQLIMSLKYTTYLFNSNIIFTLIDPSTVKKNINVKGNSGNKDLMRAAILNLHLTYCSVDIDSLDEHAIDSISVGLYGCKLLNDVNFFRSIFCG